MMFDLVTDDDDDTRVISSVFVKISRFIYQSSTTGVNTRQQQSDYVKGVGNEVLVSAVFFTLFSLVLLWIIYGHVRRLTLQIHPDQANQVNQARNYIFRAPSQPSLHVAAETGGEQPADVATAANPEHADNQLPPSVQNLSNTFRAYGMDTQCPVCLNEPRLPIRTNCGHLFCANCLIVYWRHGNWMGSVRCPVCRTQVTVMLTCFRLENAPGSTDEELNERQQVLHDINDYNRRFSGEPRPVNY